LIPALAWRRTKRFIRFKKFTAKGLWRFHLIGWGRGFMVEDAGVRLVERRDRGLRGWYGIGGDGVVGVWPGCWHGLIIRFEFGCGELPELGSEDAGEAAVFGDLGEAGGGEGGDVVGEAGGAEAG
jgi:hypothetical protein